LRDGVLRLQNFYRAPVSGDFGDSGWWESVSNAISLMPNVFRKHPCSVVLPHFSPLLRWITVPPVERRLLRETLAEALEVDLPVQEQDFSWDFLDCGGEGHGGYIFAERKAALAPLFDLLAAMDVFPDGAAPPLMADFFTARQHTSKEMALQLCLGDAVSSLTFTGGVRPYMRYVHCGWQQLCAPVEGEEPDGPSPEVILDALSTWLAGKEIDDEALRRRFEGRRERFFAVLAEEIEKTELQYIHRFGGRHMEKLYLCSGAPDSERLRDLFGQQHQTQVVRMAPWMTIKMTRSSKKIAGEIDDLTWMRLLGTIGGDLGSQTAMAAFLPEFVLRRRQRSQYYRLATALVLFVWAILGFSSIYRFSQNQILESHLKDIRGRQAKVKVIALQMDALDSQREVMRMNFDRIDLIRRRQESWLRLFAELQEAMGESKDIWLEDFHMTNPRETAVGGESPSVALRGYALIRTPKQSGAGAKTVEQINGLFQRLRNTESIAEVADIALTPSEGYLQPFRCRLILRRNEL
jgi:hypothetical protein